VDNIFQQKEEVNITQLVEQLQTAEKIQIDKKRTLGLFYHPSFSFKYIGKNVEELTGFTQKEIYDGGLKFAYQIVYWKQLSMPLKAFQWGAKFHSRASHITENRETIVFYCGIKLKTKLGHIGTFFVKQRILQYADDIKSNAVLSYVEIEDISSIFKKDMVWARMTAQNGVQTFVQAFFSQGPKKESSDLLSEREYEILRLVAQQKGSTEISTILGISKNTVDRHRKNMIAKTGVVDMSSLVYICRSCQMI